jgi:acyl-CoA oxidase
MLETTATLDKSTDEFVIHSPTTTSTKFWPGDLGRYSTHAVVFARLKIDGKDYGVHSFIVQLRDLNTYKHLKGIRTGDLGPKFGYVTKDNGWGIFDEVRIPRNHMLMNMANVDKDGTFKLIGDMRVLYSTMMLIRTRICCEMNNPMFASLTIALRYASVRRQFATIDKSRQERQILDYQTMQHILVPILA